MNPIIHIIPRNQLFNGSALFFHWYNFSAFGEFKASSMHFFAFSILQICVWKQTFSPGKNERHRLTFDWRFSTLSQSEICVHWWTHNSKNPTNLGRQEFNPTLHQSSHSFATRIHGFATKTKALEREMPPATQANTKLHGHFAIKGKEGAKIASNRHVLSLYVVVISCFHFILRLET